VCKTPVPATDAGDGCWASHSTIDSKGGVYGLPSLRRDCPRHIVAKQANEMCDDEFRMKEPWPRGVRPVLLRYVDEMREHVFLCLFCSGHSSLTSCVGREDTTMPHHDQDVRDPRRLHLCCGTFYHPEAHKRPWVSVGWVCRYHRYSERASCLIKVTYSSNGGVMRRCNWQGITIEGLVLKRGPVLAWFQMRKDRCFW
jgi:hypothetical protein